MTRFSRRGGPAIALVPVIVACLTAAAPAAPAADLPRYGLEPGQLLVYEGDEVATTSGGRIGLERRTEVLVTRARPGGGWDVIVTQRQQRFQERNGERKDQAERLWVHTATIMPDGTSPQRGLDSIGVIDRLLPQLPADDGQVANGWAFDSSEVRHSGRVVPDAESGVFVFELIPTSDLNDLQGFSATYTYRLDRERGVITSIHVQHRYRGRDTRSGTEAIVEERRLDAADVATIAAEYDVYLSGARTYDHAVAEALSGLGADEAYDRLDQALADLRGTHAGLESERLRADLGRRIEQHLASGESFRRRLLRQGGIIGRPAPPWTLNDLEGREHSLAGYRGQVVVLDFWYRNCSFCIRSMPQLKTLASRYPSERVAVLGMNVDQKESDAQLVVDKLKIAYPTLRANRTLAMRHGVSGYPTLFVVDGRGDIRFVHVGHSPTLADDLGVVIDRLLAESP